MIIAIKVKPNARQNRLSFENGMITVRIQAVPTDGRANEAVVRFIAEQLDVPRSTVRIVGGFTAPFKRLEIPDSSKAKLESLASA